MKRLMYLDLKETANASIRMDFPRMHSLDMRQILSNEVHNKQSET
jgi:hypothetical protein